MIVSVEPDCLIHAALHPGRASQRSFANLALQKKGNFQDPSKHSNPSLPRRPWVAHRPNVRAARI